MLNNVAINDRSTITDMNGVQSAKRLDHNDPVLVDRFSRLMDGMKGALNSTQTVLPTMAVNPEKPHPRSLRDNVINDVSVLEKSIGTIFDMNDKNADKHKYLDDKGDMRSVGQVLHDYTDFSTRYFLATNYAHKTGISTMEEIQIFTKGR